jgi:hypothetical protein
VRSVSFIFATESATATTTPATVDAGPTTTTQRSQVRSNGFVTSYCENVTARGKPHFGASSPEIYRHQDAYADRRCVEIGVIMVEYINQLRTRRMNPGEAAKEGASLWLGPL